MSNLRGLKTIQKVRIRVTLVGSGIPDKYSISILQHDRKLSHEMKGKFVKKYNYIFINKRGKE